MKRRSNILLAATVLVALLSVLLISCRTSTEPFSFDLQSLVNGDPATIDNSDLPISSIEELHTTAPSPGIDIEQYRLVVDGLVQHPLSLTYSEILSRPSVTQVVLLICPGVFVDNAEWTGIPISPLLQEAGIQSGARSVVFHSSDGYSISLQLEKAETDGVFLAHHVDGQVLPLEHGYPLRLVVEGVWGSSWVKWVNHIEVVE